MRLMLCFAFGVASAVALMARPAAAEAPDPVDLAVCTFLAADHGAYGIADYVVAMAVFDLTGDGTPELLTIADEGTAHAEQFQVMKNDGTEVQIEEANVDAVDDDWQWTAGRRWLIYGGRAYALRFTGWGTGYLRYVSRIGSDNAERPLCKFEPQQMLLPFSPVHSADHDVCKAVAGRQVVYESPERYVEPQPAPGREILGGTTIVAGEAQVDFDNTGRPLPVYLYTAESGAGAGCRLSYYDTSPTDDPASLGHAQLSAMQGLDLADVYPRRTCLDAEPKWFAFGGVHYLQTESTMADTPTSERGEYQYVDVIQRGLPRRVCQTLYTHGAPKLVGVWDGANWAAPPPMGK